MSIVGFQHHGESKKELLIKYTDQPTYYHFHIHVVHINLDAGATQAVGKAFGLENLISQLEIIPEGCGIADMSLTYTLGEASELWKIVFSDLRSENR
jgi:m7GpppX diphosphatase